MKRIWVGIDGSAAAQKAAALAAEVAGRFGAQLTLAYVVPRLLLPPDAYGLTVAEVEAEHRSHADEVVRSARQALGPAGDQAAEQVLYGPPAETLAAAAAADHADLLVVGSRGHGAVARVLLGSTSDRVVHVAGMPVLVVH